VNLRGCDVPPAAWVAVRRFQARVGGSPNVRDGVAALQKRQDR
jgi:hypothetical protein